MELIDLKKLSAEEKIFLLTELGFDSDGTFVLTKEGQRVLDRYTKDPVRISNMVIVPGSTIILDNNELSLACYLEDEGKAVFAA